MNTTHAINNSNSEINVVFRGVAKSISANLLSQFINQNGIWVGDCQLLTRHETASTLAYKVSIKVKDQERCMSPNFWPPGISVESFRTRTLYKPKRFNKVLENIQNQQVAIMQRSDHLSSPSFGNGQSAGMLNHN